MIFIRHRRKLYHVLDYFLSYVSMKYTSNFAVLNHHKSHDMLKQILFFTFLWITANTGFSQLTYKSTVIDLSIEGTSTLHDWTMTSKEGTCSAVFMVDNGKLKELKSMSFTMPSKSLKSGKGGMDKNAYKALKTNDFESITAHLKQATIAAQDNTNYMIRAIIDLTIAGTSKETELIVQAQMSASGDIHIHGEKPISMKDYNMKPPSFMMGAVKTGNDVVLKIKTDLRN